MMRTTPLTLLLAAGPLFAAAPEAAERKAPSATVTVTAEARPVELAKTPHPVKVITREQIQQSGAATLKDLLQTYFPGQLMGNGGVGTSSTFFLGGARGQDVVVVLDGLRLTDASGLGSVNLAAVGLVGIDRIEVEQGPCSARFGAEAAGGVISLTTAAAPEGLSGRAKLARGTRGLQQEQAEVAYGTAQGTWLRAGLSLGQEDQAMPTARPFRSRGLHTAFGFNLGEATALTFTYRNTFMGVPIPWAKTTFPRVYAETRETQTQQEQLIGTLRSALTEAWLLEVSLGQALQARQEPAWSAPYTPFAPYDSRRNQANASLSWQGARVGTTTAFSAYEERGFTPGYPSGTDQGLGHHVALSQEAWWEPVPAFRLAGSLRQQWDRQTFVVETGPKPQEMKADSLTGRLGATLSLGGGFRAYASLGTAFGLPLLSAVMYNQQYGGEPLDREKSRFAQVGGAWEHGPWHAKVEASRTLHENLVIFDLNNWTYANAGAVRIQGAEGTFGFAQGGVSIEGFYRNQEARDTQAPQADQLRTSGVIRRPFQTLGLRSTLAWGAWRADASWGWSGGRYENFGNGLRAAKTHFNDLNGALAWKPLPALELTLRGSHLLQREWSVAQWKAGEMDTRNDAAQVAGFPAQPRSLSLEAAYRF